MQTLRRDRLCDRTEKHLQIFGEELFGSAKVALGKGSHRRTKNAPPLPSQSPATVLRADPGGIPAERRAFWCRTREAVTLKSARAGFSGMGSVFLTFCFQWFCSCRTDLDPGFSGRQKRSAPGDGWALCPKPDMPLPADGGDAGRPRFSRRAGASRDFEKERDADARDRERDGFLRRCGVPAQEAFINRTIFPVLCPFAFVQTVKKLTFRL